MDENFELVTDKHGRIALVKKVIEIKPIIVKKPIVKKKKK